ncbi:MAG: InlB B-repeat-containing protein [Paludibacteraceae bacterium]|nr:InlB B-repeat-containing protein [Paludibacteraceae bacterium]
MKTKVLAFLMLLVAATIEVQASTITLTSETGEIELQDGDVLTGTGGTNTRVSIADGATVTLDDVNIDANDNQWPGIACNGNAEIVLMGTTSLHGGTQRPGIFVPAGSTLTISGEGALTAVGAMSAAGIGGGYYIDCGKIVIRGGIINAIGGYSAAGIGCGAHGICGSISILGGSVTATGGSRAAGIGGAETGSYCGNITIGSKVTNLFVTAGEDAYAIGGGYRKGDNSVELITIADCVIDEIIQSPFAFTPADTTTTYTIHFDKNNDNTAGTMEDQVFTFNKPRTLTPCGFAYDEYHYFAGWNTSANGKGAAYKDKQTVINVGDVTFYAQWKGIDYSITYVNAKDGDSCVINTNPTSYTIDDDITLVEPLRPGWNFDGWTYEGQETPTKEVNIPRGSIGKRTFTAHWSFNPIATINTNTRDVLLYDGHTLTGTGGKETHVTIADGATVTLRDVNITNIKNNSAHKYAGITCLGDATIILAEDNAITGGYHSAGIFVPSDKTLTISGNGSLTATGNDYSAGIGGNQNTDCGNIVIAGGSITASGGKNAAGIGSGYNRVSCGDITIARTVTSVTATKGENATHSIGIGNGKNSTCGIVTIGGVEGYISESPYTYIPGVTLTSVVHFDANGGEGAMDDWLFTCDGSQQIIPASTFTAPEGFILHGWNTAVDGSGQYYAPDKPIVDIGNVTLYAQWMLQTVTINSSTGELTLNDGQTITGTGGKETHVTIVDGATVTLRDVNITSIPRNSSHKWAGITCLGDATIILVGDNAITGGYYSAGIFIPDHRTLTIRGNGSLIVESKDSYSPGIGGNKGTDCGNILIAGGSITATGGRAAIGCAYNASCGNITITDGVTYVFATKSSASKYVYPIGLNGSSSTCGTISIAEELTDVTVDKTRYIAKPDWTDTISVTLTKEGYATYFSSFDMVLPAGMKARIVTADEGNGQLTYKTIAKGGTPDNTVPAQTPVLLQMPSADNEQTLNICIMAPNSLLTIDPNLLGGKDKESWTTGGGEEAKYYKLSYDSVGSNLGWYWGEENGESYKSEAHHAWLTLKSNSASLDYSFLPLPDYNYDDITTAIPVIVEPSMNGDDASARPRKVLEGNTVVIIRFGQRYDLLGRKMK